MAPTAPNNFTSPAPSHPRANGNISKPRPSNRPKNPCKNCASPPKQLSVNPATAPLIVNQFGILRTQRSKVTEKKRTEINTISLACSKFKNAFLERLMLYRRNNDVNKKFKPAQSCAQPPNKEPSGGQNVPPRLHN